MKNLFLKLDDEVFGKLQGKVAILPNVMLVEEGTGIDGKTIFTKTCMQHEKPIPDNGCDECL